MSAPQTQEATPETAKADSYIEQYELPDSSFDPELDSPPAASAPPAESVQPAAPPRDPDTGRFVPKGPEHSPRIRRMAQDFGMSEEEIASTSPAELEAAVSLVGRHLTRLHNQNVSSRGQNEYVGREEPEPERAERAVRESFDLGIKDESAYDPELLGVIKRLAAKVDELSAMSSEFAAMKPAFAELQKSDRVRKIESFRDMVDRKFAELPPEYHAYYGTGKRHELKDGAPEVRRRLAVLGLMKDMPKENGFDRNFQDAVDTISPPRPPEAKPSLSEEQKEWLNGGLSKPTQRVVQEPKGIGRATKAVARKMRDNGAYVDEYAGTEEAGLPD